MINNSILFNLFKPFTQYKIVIGGMALPIDVENGTILINFITTKPISKSNKQFLINESKIKENSVLETSFQIDFYRVNPMNILYIDAYLECEKVKEYLRSYAVQEYLKEFNIELLPVISNTTYLTDFTEQKKLVNRAFFELNLIYNSADVIEDMDTINKIIITNKYIFYGKGALNGKTKDRNPIRLPNTNKQHQR